MVMLLRSVILRAKRPRATGGVGGRPRVGNLRSCADRSGKFVRRRAEVKASPRVHIADTVKRRSGRKERWKSRLGGRVLYNFRFFPFCGR